MSTKRWFKFASWPLLGAALVAPMFIQCGGGMGDLPGGANIPGGIGKCPDMTNAEAVLGFDWAGTYKIDAASAERIKGGVAAAVELKGVAAQIDADLKTGCGALAHDLGAAGDYKTGKEACDAAIKAINDTKAKLGKVTIALDMQAPKCGASMDVVADCAAKCDATVKPGSAKVECEPGKLQGQCSAQCEGSCDVEGGAKCDGQCSGKCDAKISGKCDGTCDGKCDGKPGKASCAGTCEGTCTGNVEGSCSGSCSGSCQLKAKAECKGTCSGSCSAEMKAPKCTGEVKPPQMSAECKAHCDAKAEAKVECTPAHIGVRISGGDAAQVAKFKTALEKDLPLIAKVALGMGDRVKKLGGDVKTVVEGAQSVVQTAAQGAAATGAALTACVAAPFKDAIDAAGGMSADVSVSVNVSASVSGGAGGGSASGGASASASGSAGAH